MPRTQRKVSRALLWIWTSYPLLNLWRHQWKPNLCCSKPACGTGKSLISSLPITCVYYIQRWSSRNTGCSVFSINSFVFRPFAISDCKTQRFCKRLAVIMRIYSLSLWHTVEACTYCIDFSQRLKPLIITAHQQTLSFICCLLWPVWHVYVFIICYRASVTKVAILLWVIRVLLIVLRFKS